MLSIIIKLSGGIGLFLLGMALMTDSIKAMAGDSLRQWLTRFTGSPLKAMFSGIGFTMIVQSSTATTLATIGFVSAGVLSFAQAIGVIIGANIGTTSTGWMVAFLGLKFSVTAFALPMIGIGAMLKLLGKNTLSLLGMSLAGFGLLFLGIDFLQDAMAGFANQVTLSHWSNNDLTTRLVLVAVGLIMTILLQSSTAAIVATMAALSSHAIDLPQALALVIGQNVGTVATAVLASVGATVSAKRTAAVHVIFNVITAVMAFFVLLPFTLWIATHIALDNTIIIAAFHTAFSLMGAVIFMPLTHQLQLAIERLLPEHHTPNTQFLDESLFELPAVAISTAKQALCQSLAQTYDLLVKSATKNLPNNQVNTQLLDDTLTKVELYLTKLPVPQSQNDQQHLINLLRLIVYSRVIRDDLLNIHFMDILSQNNDDTLNTVIAKIRQLSTYLMHIPKQELPPEFIEEFVAFGELMKAEKNDIRTSILQHTAATQTHASDALDKIVARRWLDRVMKHTTKMVMLLGESHSIR